MEERGNRDIEDERQEKEVRASMERINGEEMDSEKRKGIEKVLGRALKLQKEAARGGGEDERELPEEL